MKPIHARLTEAIDQYEVEFEEETSPVLDRPEELHPEEKEIIAELGSPAPLFPALLNLGSQALSLAENLSGDDWEANYTVQRGAEGYFFGIPAAGLEIAAARRLVDLLPGFHKRASEIVWLVLNEHPSERVRSYMRPLARCYLSGFDTEVVILCRSVLDTALQEVVGNGDEGPNNMYQRIEYLRETKFFDKATAAAAHRIRIRGNKAVHEEPAQEGVATDTIELTLEILTALFPSE